MSVSLGANLQRIAHESARTTILLARHFSNTPLADNRSQLTTTGDTVVLLLTNRSAGDPTLKAILLEVSKNDATAEGKTSIRALLRESISIADNYDRHAKGISLLQARMPHETKEAAHQTRLSRVQSMTNSPSPSFVSDPLTMTRLIPDLGTYRHRQDYYPPQRQ